LCYLAAVYTNLLVHEQPMLFYFKPKASSFPDGILRVAPDLLPPGRVKLSNVWIDDQPYDDFDKEKMTVRLPEGKEVRVRVRLVSATSELDSQYEHRDDGDYRLTLVGAIPAKQVEHLRAELDRALRAQAQRLVLLVTELESLCEEAFNELLFFRSKVKLDQQVVVVGANERVKQAFASADASTGGEFIHLDKE
jgi:anti-anti-sigma regulatory factor